MDKQIFVDRILETENLTSDLEDEAADALIKWGLAQLDLVLEGITEDEPAAARVGALMKVMRGVNRIVGNHPTPAPEKVGELAALYAQAFGRLLSTESVNASAIAAQAASLPARAAVMLTLDWVQKQTASS